MSRSKGDMASPGHLILILAAFYFSACIAGPLPNVTSVDLGLKEGSCALGDVVYMSGDQLPGTSPCERCKCSDGYVDCARQTCEPRPGCKALHRPDHCCPTYQCECEQEGRIYGNGEKLVDPMDPCRVCYCQGGEVVCRRIACFVRDDCQPRLVPGRCCPEYDNCPVRDGTPIPGMVSSAPSLPVYDNVETSAIPSPPSDPIKPEITIKEITPVSEIPVITDVKIKEILPSPSIDVSEYSSSKSPLITREATTENNLSNMDKISKVDLKDGLPSSSPELSSNDQSSEIKTINDMPPSKISLSNDEYINGDMSPSKIPNIVSMMGAPISDSGTSTTKAPILEEEDLDHNPAFPPIPDDLFLVLSNHDEEIISDQSIDNEHVPMDHDIVKVPNVPISTQEPIFKEPPATTISYISDIVTITSDSTPDTSSETSTFKDVTVSTQFPITKENSMLSMRSVIPTEILNVPSLISDEITGEMLDATQSTSTAVVNAESSPTEILGVDLSTKYTKNEHQDKDEESYSNVSFNDTQTSSEMDETTNTLSKSTEIISETEFSSIPIETSDQNPHDVSEKEAKDKLSASTVNLIMTESSTLKSLFNDEDVITISKSSEKEDQPFDNSETTEFYLTSFDSQESSTDAVELIKAPSNSDKSSAIIESSRKKDSNVLTDLINLVGDVASISDHTEGLDPERQQTPSPTTISDSEELIPVNVAAGYKSKNKNWNLNSITEVPLKHKVPMMVSKQNVVEIESDDSDAITDSAPPNDKVEPTTRRPIIDNVSDTDNNTEVSDKKDIEIITQSYVPTINRRPNKVVMKKSNEKPISEESLNDASVTTPEGTAESISSSNELTNIPDLTVSSSKDITSTPEVNVSTSSDVKSSPEANESTSELEDASLDVSSLPVKEQSTESSSTTTQ